ncbi:MAG: hypothetical protein IH984_11855 [Planctomycetes bacterium]|nr:hypothetical protein [Planctomycetota bacterium]
MNLDKVTDAAMRLNRVEPHLAMLVFLLERDIDNAMLSFGLFEAERSKTFTEKLNIRELMNHASCFVCAVRRVGRLFEKLVSQRSCLTPTVAKAVQLEWRKKKSFFDSFIDPRNAIEHIDSEIDGKTFLRLFQLTNDRLEVTNGKSVTINREAIAKLTESLDRIAEAILSGYPDPATVIVNAARTLSTTCSSTAA